MCSPLDQTYAGSNMMRIMRIGPNIRAVLILCSIWRVAGLISISDATNLIISFLGERKWSSAMLFTCLRVADNVNQTKLWASNGIHLTVYSLDQDVDPKMLMTLYHHLAVILDLSCSGSGYLLAQASKEKHFSSLHHWLLLSEKTLSLSVDPLITTLEPFDLQLDSHVTIAHIGSSLKQVLLQDVYRIGRQDPLIITPPRDWTSGQLISPGSQIDNYNGIHLRTSVLVVDGTWDTHTDLNYRHLNTESKINYVLMTYVSEMLNFRMNITLTDTWGYPEEGPGCFSGIVGTLQCGECEISATGVMWKMERMDVIDYVTEITKFRGAFMFLKPSLSEVSIIYELPFSTSVWATYILTVAFLTVVLVFVQHVERHVRPLSSPDHPVSWSDAVLDTVGIVCQQGTENIPKNLASRMVFIFMMLLSLFLLTSYSAIIVSLIQTTSSSISTLTDLTQSAMKLSMNDKLANEITDPAVEKVFKEKLYTQPFHEAFITDEVGVERIRRGLNAFHGLNGAYKIISDTYEEHEKCRFKEIKMFEANHVGFPIRKGSPYTEHIRQRTHWLREAGMVGREETRWYYPKPRCETSGQNFVSVGIQEFYPTLVILSYGIFLSIVMLVVEVVYNKYQHILLVTSFKSCTRKIRN